MHFLLSHLPTSTVTEFFSFSVQPCGSVIIRLVGVGTQLSSVPPAREKSLKLPNLTKFNSWDCKHSRIFHGQ
jgi:hypothetical protein